MRLIFHTHSHFSPVALPLPSSPRLAKVNNRQKGCANGETDKRYANEAVLQTQRVNPGRDGVSDGEAHGIANDDDGGEGIARNAVEGVDEVGNGEGDATGRTDGETHHGEDETEPVNLVGGL